MKAFLTLGVAIGLYCGTYFLFVSHIDVGFSSMGTFWVDSVVPAYWRAPEWLHAAAFYKPIHVVDEKYLRHSTWQPHQRRIEIKPGQRRPLNNTMHADSARTLGFHIDITVAEPVMANRYV